MLSLIGAGLAMYRKRRESAENGDGPPKHKPPPPYKTGTSTEMLHKSNAEMGMKETQPLSNYDRSYYDTTAAEPVTDLDDDNASSPANGGAPSAWEGSEHPSGLDETASDSLPPYEPSEYNNVEAKPEPPPANIARGESFVSPSMLV